MTNIQNKIIKGINLIPYKFKNKPLVLGGLAMEYYGLRETTHDYDYMVSPEDWKNLKIKYPNNINLFGGKTEEDVDATINLLDINVDLISTLYQIDYNFLKKGSTEFNDYLIISVDKQLLVKTLERLTNKTHKSIQDTQLLTDFICLKQYSKDKIFN